MKVKANRVVGYGGKEYKAGDEFDMKDTDAKVNILNKRVSAVQEDHEGKPRKEKPKVDKGKVKTKPVQADDAAADDGKSDKGKYKRRDMRAEDQHTEGGTDKGED